MRILILNQYALPPGAAGITRHVDLGMRLVRLGHEVTIVASDVSYLSRTKADLKQTSDSFGGVRFEFLSTGSYRENDRQRVRSMLAFSIRATWPGLRLRPRPDVVIGSSPQLLAGVSALVIARLLRRPFVFEVRDPWPSALVDLGGIKEGGLTHRLLERIERMLYRRADRIIDVMGHIDERVAEVGEDAAKCVHIPNASSWPPMTAQVPESLRALIEREKSDGRMLMLYAGAHGVSNGLHDVLDALELLRTTDRAAYDRLALLFVGAGPEKEGLQARATGDGHDHVHFHPPIPKAELLGAMQLSDFVLVHFAGAAFKRYGMSANKLFDGMAAGRPVLVATQLNDTPVDTARCGLRYEPGSPTALAETLGRATALSGETRDEMGRRGTAEIEGRYSLDVTARQLEELLQDVVARHRR